MGKQKKKWPNVQPRVQDRVLIPSLGLPSFTCPAWVSRLFPKERGIATTALPSLVESSTDLAELESLTIPSFLSVTGHPTRKAKNGADHLPTVFPIHKIVGLVSRCSLLFSCLFSLTYSLQVAVLNSDHFGLRIKILTNLTGPESTAVITGLGAKGRQTSGGQSRRPSRA